MKVAVTMGHNWWESLREACRKHGRVIGMDRDQPCDVTVYVSIRGKTIDKFEDQIREELKFDGWMAVDKC